MLALGGGAAVAWPRAASGQQPPPPVIGFLSGGLASLEAEVVRAFRQGLLETGHSEGHNVAIEFLWADGKNDRLPALAADLVHRQVSVIVALGSTPPPPAAKGGARNIPHVLPGGTDPLDSRSVGC